MITQILMYVVSAIFWIPMLPFALIGAIFGLFTGEIWDII